MAEQDEVHTEEAPPVFSKWSGWYALVLGELLALIIIFSLITAAYQ